MLVALVDGRCFCSSFYQMKKFPPTRHFRGAVKIRTIGVGSDVSIDYEPVSKVEMSLSVHLSVSVCLSVCLSVKLHCFTSIPFTNAESTDSACHCRRGILLRDREQQQRRCGHLLHDPDQHARCLVVLAGACRGTVGLWFRIQLIMLGRRCTRILW